jgi:hypothetical protein
MLSVGDNVQYQGKMYTIDRVVRSVYHLEGTHKDFLIKRRHLRKYPLCGLTGRPLAEAIATEPPTYHDAIKRICQGGLTPSDMLLLAKSSTP